MTSKHIVVLTTAADDKEAKRIADLLLNKRKAACVNIVPKVGSLFLWQGKIDSAKESLLIVKTKASALEDIVKKWRIISFKLRNPQNKVLTSSSQGSKIDNGF